MQPSSDRGWRWSTLAGVVAIAAAALLQLARAPGVASLPSAMPPPTHLAAPVDAPARQSPQLLPVARPALHPRDTARPTTAPSGAARQGRAPSGAEPSGAAPSGAAPERSEEAGSVPAGD